MADFFSPVEDESTEFFAQFDTPPSPFPQSAIKNRAATVAMLTNTPETALANYQDMIAEGDVGDTTTQQALTDVIMQESEKRDLTSVLSILSDPNINIEQKENVIRSHRIAQANKDVSDVLFTNALTEPSEGETFTEEAARISTAEWAQEVHESRRMIQGYVNAIQKDRGNASVPEMLEAMFQPFASSAVGVQLSGPTWKDVAKGAILPGSAIADMREKWLSMPIDQRAIVAQQMVEEVANASGLIISDQNQFVALQNLENIFGDEFTDGEKWFENVVAWLDIFGAGTSIRAGARALKGARGAKIAKAPPGAPTEAPEPFTPPPADLTTPMPDARTMRGSQELEDEAASLLGKAADKMEPDEFAAVQRSLSEAQAALDAEKAIPVQERLQQIGRYQNDMGMKFRDAKARVEHETFERTRNLERKLASIQDQVSRHNEALKAEQRLTTIDTQLKVVKTGKASAPAKLNPIMDALRRTEMNSVGSTHNPSSPGAILMHTNPQKARAVHATVFKSESEEVAQALYGTSKNDAVADNILPQAKTESGKVRSKPNDMDRALRAEMLEQLSDIVNSGGIEFSPKELAQARANVVRDFTNIDGLSVNTGMGGVSVSEDGSKLNLSAVYGTSDGGWSSAEDAAKQAEYALRDFGVKPGEIQILQKQGLDHVPVKLEDVKGKDGHYLVQVNTERGIEVQDMKDWEKFDTKRSWFSWGHSDRMDSSGSLQQWLVDAASSLHPTLTGSAVTGADKAARLQKTLVKLSNEFTKPYKALPRERREAMMDYIKEANFKGIKQTYSDLQARGFSDAEKDILKKWETFWDAHYYLENLDVVRTLRASGYKVFNNAETTLIAKPVGKNISLADRIYDPASDSVVTLTREQMDELYDVQGGSFAALRRPVEIDGELVNNMIVRNSPDEYLKAFRDDDKVLSYRPGYFQLTYRAPKFVEKLIRDSNGRVIETKVLAVAGNTEEATFYAKRIADDEGIRFDPTTDEFSDIRVRGDRSLNKDSDAFWDLESSNGRIAQRHRGKRLEDASGTNYLGKSADYIEDPIESAVQAAKSVSGRTVMRPVIETAKTRFTDQFKHLITERDDFGNVIFPTSASKLARKGTTSNKELRDARTTYAQIRHWEQGYVNSVDNSIKAIINTMSESFGKMGATKLERAFGKASEGAGVTGEAKRVVYHAYLGLGPLRQLILQPHGAVRAWAYNPKSFHTAPRYASEWMMSLGGKFEGFTKDGKEFIDAVNSTGMLQAIDQNNLVRSTLAAAGNRTGRVMKPFNAVLNGSRTIGFDAGETMNILVHFGAVFDKYKRAGFDVASKEVRAKMHAEARSLMFNMNFSGDMPYNANFAAAVLQFAQVPHKTLMSVFNRQISVAERSRLFLLDTILWGGPVTLIGNAIIPDEMLPEDPVIREWFQEGLEGMLLNNLLQIIMSDDTNVDFSSLNPYDVSGITRMLTALWSDGGVSSVIANSPIGTLVGKDGGRVHQAWQTTLRYFSILDDDADDPTSFVDVVDDIASIASGWDAASKARIQWKVKQAVDKNGRVTDDDVTRMEAIWQAAGFPSKATSEYYETVIPWSKDRKKHEEESIKIADSIIRLAAKSFEGERDRIPFAQKTMSLLLRAFEDDPVGAKIARNRLKMQLEDPSNQIFKNLIQMLPISPASTLRADVASLSHISEEDRAKMLKLIKDVENMKNLDKD